jgi:hypothetical protein
MSTLECQNCMRLAGEMAAIRAIVERLEKTLLGNGQPGQCAAHGLRLSRLERWRAWITGALAIVGVLWMAAATLGGAVLVARLKR